MPKGRIKRKNTDCLKLNGTLCDMRQECICSLDGFCDCFIDSTTPPAVNADGVVGESDSDYDSDLNRSPGTVSSQRGG